MTNSVPSLRWMLPLGAIAFLSCAHIQLYGEAAKVELTSTKNDDHFDVTRPPKGWVGASELHYSAGSSMADVLRRGRPVCRTSYRSDEIIFPIAKKQ